MKETDIQLILLETNFNPVIIDEYSNAIYNNYEKVKKIVADLVEGEVTGKGIIYKTAMKQCGQQRIPYAEAEMISAVLADKLEALYLGMFDAT